MGGRYQVLDGLRGTAALSVVAFHVCLYLGRGGAPVNALHHAYLAVDFFFLLSGFVIAHAYDHRRRRMKLKTFLLRRLLRLHPMVPLGVALGVVSYLVGEVLLLGYPFWPKRFAGNLLFGLLLLPAPTLPGIFGQTHSLDPPSWSLTQEYLANLAYGLAGRRLGVWLLKAVLAVAGVALLAICLVHGSVNVGVVWDTFWLAPVRTAFPFFAGVFLQRSGVSLRIPGGWLLLSVVLVAVFAGPELPALGPLKLNGLYDAAAVLLVFPLVIAAGAASEAIGPTRRLCHLSGEISYPLYIIHAPFLNLLAAWLAVVHLARPAALACGAATGLLLPLVAWAALKAYDEPVRRWLTHGRGGDLLPSAAASAAAPASQASAASPPSTLG